ncbi:hypothetical protein [Halobacterium yunchengense]|uniref:DUF7857 domain-containing protein n=1 Tax=Halobacterium yunchengense TaxID=3108497 RepID=UPI00300836B0
MDLETATERRRGVTLVSARLHNDAEHAVRVRVADRCGGSVWPPREDGLPAPGWDDGGWEGVLGAGETHPLGYATAARPPAPPVEVAWTERAAEGEPSPAAALADLGDPRPPRDAVAPPTASLPSGVREWLDGVAARADRGETTDEDRAGVAALAARANRLRGVVEE